MHKDLAKAAELTGVELPALEEASKTSERLLDQFKEVLKEQFSLEKLEGVQKTDIVLLGSIARGESSHQSDCDYFVLQNGAPPNTTQALIKAAEQITNDVANRQPGPQGVFGQVVVAPNLFESIGLECDTNTNMTRRVLLLSESKPVTMGATHNETIDNILSRYCADYLPPNRAENSPAKVPRYLLNDLVRYWRTMAVDFGSKRRLNGDSHIRLAKLRITRKILFAGPLSTVLLAPKHIANNSDLQSYLKKSFEGSPLAQLAKHTSSLNDASKEAMKILLQNYDRFISVLSGGKRDVLKGIKGDTKSKEEIRKQCREIGDNIQSSLEKIFYEDPLFQESFRRYSVF